ncbi:MAG: DUF4097 family beta strand repeat protein [Balneolaceae bacterium]|nr:DUF4097 family beta strand repeat protein [Balneolaceae bacterium]
MKKQLHILSLFVFTLLFSVTSFAQDRLAVPLSNPGEPGKLELGVVRGTINVSGYDGNEVLINYTGGPEKGNSQNVTKDGLRRITNNSVGFEVEEDENVVEIGSVSPMHDISFDISVPRNFSLELSSVHGGGITIENVSGDLEVSNVNGEITLINISGAAVANTVNGDIKATFNRVSADKPMAFSNLNGDIDVTLPANAKVSAKMKSEWGEIYTDFDMNINRSDEGAVNTSSDSDTYKVSVNNWIYGDINGGGPEYLFKSMRGDIYIRKK